MKHDQHPDISDAFKAKTSPNVFDKDERTLSQAKEIVQEWSLGKEAIRTEFESLIIKKNEIFETVVCKSIRGQRCATKSINF